MGKLTSFIIGMIVFMVFMGAGVIPLMNEFSPPNYDEDTLQFYNKLSNVTDDTKDIKDSSLDLQSKSGVLDVLGGFVESAYDTIKIAANSFELFDLMKDQAIEDTNVNNAGIIRSAITSIVIIAIFLGIIVAAVIKRDL